MFYLSQLGQKGNTSIICVTVIIPVYLKTLVNDRKRCLEILINKSVRGHVNSWVTVTHEIHEHHSPMNNNDSTVLLYETFISQATERKVYLIQDISAEKHPFSILQQFGSEKNINDHNHYFVHGLVSILIFILLSTKHVNTNAFRETS